MKLALPLFALLVLASACSFLRRLRTAALPRCTVFLLAALVVSACSPPTTTATSHTTKSNKTTGSTDDPNAPNKPAGNGDNNGDDPSSQDTPDVPLPAAFEPTALKAFFDTQIAAARAPGASVAVVKNGKVAWTQGYGLANIEENRPVTPDTLFQLASISKTVMAVALMQLIEDPSRGLSLDQDINLKLPFSVRNPNFPSTPITYRMLLTHSSSLIDSQAYVDSSFPLAVGDSPIPLKTFTSNYVARQDSWATTAPGTVYSYSNTGATVAGLLVEQISGQDLQTYCVAKIFGPLGMNESSWFFKGLDPTHVAMPYQPADSGPGFVSQGQYGYPDYPDGQLRTSVKQLGRYLAMFGQKGQLGNVRVLTQASVVEMEREQIPTVSEGQGLIWYYAGTGTDRALGHNGAYLGISTDMWFDPATTVGYILLTNGGAYMDDPPVDSKMNAMNAMNGKLWDLAHALP